jgi:hypothetical protein
VKNWSKRERERERERERKRKRQREREKRKKERKKERENRHIVREQFCQSHSNLQQIFLNIQVLFWG